MLSATGSSLSHIFSQASLHQDSWQQGPLGDISITCWFLYPATNWLKLSGLLRYIIRIRLPWLSPFPQLQINNEFIRSSQEYLSPYNIAVLEELYLIY